MDPILEGLRKAGLSIPENDDSSDSPRRIEPVTSRAEPAETRVSGRSFPASRLAWIGAIVLAVVGAGWWFAHPASKQVAGSSSVSASRAVPVANQKSIAVLPFVNLSADKNDEYLSDGMTEELLNVLAKVKACACRDEVLLLLSREDRRQHFSQSGRATACEYGSGRQRAQSRR